MIEIFQHFIKRNNKGGLGVYAVHHAGDSFITVTTSVCSNDDQYCKKIACGMLRNQYREGEVVRLPLPGDVNRKNPTHRQIRDTILILFNAVDFF